MFGNKGTGVLMALAVAGLCGGPLAFGQDDLTVVTELTKVQSPVPSGFSPGDWDIQTWWGTGGGGAQPWPAPASVGFESLGNGTWVMTIFLPNWIDNMPIKNIRGSIYLGSDVQIQARALYGEDSGQIVVGSIWVTPDPTDPLRLNLGGRMEPNPDFEYLEFVVPEHPSLGNPIDGFYIETESLPAPGVLSTIGIAALAATRRRR